MADYRFREWGAACLCTQCRELIDEDGPRWEPVNIAIKGRICVKCYEQKRKRYAR